MTQANPWGVMRFKREADTPLDWSVVRADLDSLESTQSYPLGSVKSSSGAVWIYIPVTMQSEDSWVFCIDNRLIVRLSLYLAEQSTQTTVQQADIGARMSGANAALGSISMCIPLRLQNGKSYGLWARVDAGNMSKLLPVSLRRTEVALSEAEKAQLVMGLVCGAELSLLLYCLVQWVTLRDPLFWAYSFMTLGVLLANVLNFGIGRQFLWPDSVWMQVHMDSMVRFMATGGSFFFLSKLIASVDPARHRLMRVMHFCGAASLVFLSVDALGLLTPATMVDIGSVWSLLPTIIGGPYFARWCWQRKFVGVIVLLTLFLYAGTIVLTFGAIAGIPLLPPISFWLLHSFPMASLVDSILFLVVIGVQTHKVRQAAENASTERDTFYFQAHADPLTGLLNRRGLDSALANLLPKTSPDSQAAVMVLDLDGFKPINDTYGHDVGDVLLRAVAQRLKGQVRSSDLVVRLGGDEFVVVTRGLSHAVLVQELATKLLHVLQQPYRLDTTLGNIQVHVGVTIGYCMAPTDSLDAFELIKFADIALYEGKRQGKGCVRRYAKA